MTEIISIVIPFLIFLILILAICFLLFILISSFYSDFKGAPYISNDDNVIYEALKLVGLSDSHFLVDLGSGNGKVLSIAKSKFASTNSVGYEIAPWPYLLSKYRGVNTIKKSFFDADLSKVDVVYVYLLPNLLKKLAPKLKEAKDYNKNLKIVSTVFKIDGLNIVKESNCYHKAFRKNVQIFIY